MIEGLTQYLLERKQLPLAGIGLLKVEKKPAEYNIGERTIQPPKIDFLWLKESDEDFSVQPVIGYLSQVTGQTEEESFDAYHSFCHKIKESLLENGSYALQGLGKIVALRDQNFGFVHEPDFDQYLAPVEAVKLVHQGRSHQMKVGDQETTTQAMKEWHENVEPESSGSNKWWIPTLILGVIAITLIVLRTRGDL